MMINSNSFIGIGASNPSHRLNIVGDRRSNVGPHMAFYTRENISHPMYQMRHWDHDDISHTFDSYWNSNRWVSSTNNLGAFKIAKSNGFYEICSTCNITLGETISNWENVLMIHNDGRIGIGGSNRLHKFNILGTSNNLTKGPNVGFYLDGVAHPMLQLLNRNHDDISQSFDGYWNGTSWLSSITGTTGIYRVAKSNTLYGIYGASNPGIGNVISWKTALLVDKKRYI